VVLADAEETHADLVGEDTLLDEVPDRLGMRERAIVVVVRDVAEGVEAEDELHGSGERDLAEIDRDDEGLVERLAVGGAREDPVLGGELDARDLLVVAE
jgi:hypothetical protein